MDIRRCPYSSHRHLKIFLEGAIAIRYTELTDRRRSIQKYIYTTGALDFVFDLIGGSYFLWLLTNNCGWSRHNGLVVTIRVRDTSRTGDFRALETFLFE